MQAFCMSCGGQVVVGSSRKAENNFGTDLHLENLACQFTGPLIHGLVSDATLSPEPFSS